MKMRAGRYGRRLEAATGRAVTAQGVQCWSQRVDACKRSVRSLAALGSFAELGGGRRQVGDP